MQVSVTFRNVEPTDSLKEFAAEKIARIGKYIHTPTDAHVVLTVEKHRHKADITLKAHGMMMRGKNATEDMYASIDGAVEKIERQVKRYRKKLTNHKHREGQIAKVKLNYIEAERTPDPEPEPESMLPAQIVETKEIDVRPLTVEEAIMQMDLIHNDFLVFTNARTDTINVLYRRSEGFGLIETPK